MTYSHAFKRLNKLTYFNVIMNQFFCLSKHPGNSGLGQSVVDRKWGYITIL